MNGKSYRVSVKVQNANLLRAIERAGYACGPKFAELAGVGYNALLALANMTARPVGRNGDLTATAEKLCCFLNRPAFELFDRDQMQYALETNSGEIDADIEELRAISNGLSTMAKQKAIARAMGGLTERESEVLRLRFGFDCGAHTGLEVAAIFGVTAARIHDIEKHAIRKLRHPKNGITDGSLDL